MSTGSAALGALCLVFVLWLSGCAGTSFRLHGNAWRSPDAHLAVPDLTREGWERVRLDGADLAFRRGENGVIAVRARCGQAPRPLEWAGRELWFGIERGEVTLAKREIAGRPAVETSGEADGVTVRAVVVESGDCIFDFAYVRPADVPASDALEGFLARIEFMGEP